MVRAVLVVLSERARRRPGSIVAAMLSIAATLAFIMATSSTINKDPTKWSGPPDEYLHNSAAHYYIEHWLPPRVGDTATLKSYSPDYGFSYLNDSDPVYFFAGKFAHLIALLVPDHERAFRLFNVLLLAILAGLCARRQQHYLLLVPLLLTPQVWYIFSYFNGDAFPLFLAFVIGYETLAPDSSFNRYLEAPGIGRRLWGAFLVGGLVALLVASKKNYYTFLAFLPFVLALARLGRVAALCVVSAVLLGASVYLGWLSLGMPVLIAIVAGCAAIALAASVRSSQRSRTDSVRMLLKLGVACLVPALLLASRYGLDVAIQGSLEKKNAAIGTMQEHLARPDYKPSKIYSGDPEAFRGFTLRARGVSMAEMFRPPWKWHLATFLSATGHYGWLQYRSPTPYYALLGAAYAVLALYLVWSAARSRDADAWLHLFGFCIFSCLTVGVSFWHSWNDDFQAQGRYLFPILPMLAVGLESSRKYLSPRVILALVTICFTLSAYSFIFTALWQIPKAS